MHLVFSFLSIFVHSCNVIFQKNYTAYSNQKKYDEYMQNKKEVKRKTFQDYLDEAKERIKEMDNADQSQQ